MTRRTQFKWLAALALVAACAALALPAAGQSSRATWSTPIVLGPGWWQKIVVDVTGSVHVFWYGVIPDQNLNDVVMYATRERLGEWRTTDVIATLSNIANTRPSPAVSSDGRLFLAYRQYLWHMFSHTLVKDAFYAHNWSPPVRINDQGYYVDLLVDKDNVLHLVFNARFDDSIGVNLAYLENSICPLCYDLFYQRSEDGGKTWSALYPLSVDPSTGSDRMDVIQGNSGNLYIFWDEGLDWHIGRGAPKDVRIVYSSDGGINWSDPIILDGGNFPGRRPLQIGMTELFDQSLLVVWRYSSLDHNRIYYQVSTDLGENWTSPEPIPGICARSINDTPLDDYELITDLVGVGHLFATGSACDPNSPVGLYHIEFRQQRWQQPELLFENPSRNPEWPKAAVGPQNDLHVTWFNRYGEKGPDGSEAGLEVMYMHRRPTLPDRPTQEFRPTEAPQPTATPVQRFQPTTTPFPTAVPIEQQVNVRTTSDLYAIQTLLSAVFVCLVLCGGVLALRGFRPRR